MKPLLIGLAAVASCCGGTARTDHDIVAIWEPRRADVCAVVSTAALRDQTIDLVAATAAEALDLSDREQAELHRLIEEDCA